MMKIVFVLCAFLAVSFAQEQTTEETPQKKFELVPFVSNLCTNGCPKICQTLRTLCPPTRAVDCGQMKTMCDAICAQSCSCVNQCGPDCDKYVQGCVDDGLPQISSFICPLNSRACDFVCILSCPQQVFAQFLQNALQQLFLNVSQFVQTVRKNIAPPPS